MQSDERASKNKKLTKDSNKLYLFLCIALLVIILDQITKEIVVRYLQNRIPVIGDVLFMSQIRNTGAGFGLFQGTNQLMVFLSLCVIGLILYLYDEIPDKRNLVVSVALILGGGVGNLLDRIRLGYVFDFIDLKWWPAFNLADTAITLGIIGFMYFSWKD